MTNPFSSAEHGPASPTRCRCGDTFSDALALDTHILGPELANAHHRDVAAAIAAIHAKVDEMAGDGHE